MEQQRMIEDLQFKSTHTELQKQLVEQKLVLQTIQQQVESGHDNNNNNGGDVSNVKMDKKSGYKQSNVRTSVQPSKTATSKSTGVKPGARPSSSGPTKHVANQLEANKGVGNDTARTGATAATTNRYSIINSTFYLYIYIFITLALFVLYVLSYYMMCIR